ncbi:hypothetical protein ykris0001_37280 [Yersinia kristensenii ATCC 33638]|nr:hypothetical protein ykris0001_37280 [Yersinia kristensenii ATCC 33638]
MINITKIKYKVEKSLFFCVFFNHLSIQKAAKSKKIAKKLRI